MVLRPYNHAGGHLEQNLNIRAMETSGWCNKEYASFIYLFIYIGSCITKYVTT